MRLKIIGNRFLDGSRVLSEKIKKYPRFVEGRRVKLEWQAYRDMWISEPFYTVEVYIDGASRKFYFQLRGDGALNCSVRPIKKSLNNKFVFKFNSKYLGRYGKQYRLSKERTQDGVRIMIENTNNRQYYRTGIKEKKIIFLNELDVRMIRNGRDSLKRRLLQEWEEKESK